MNNPNQETKAFVVEQKLPMPAIPVVVPKGVPQPPPPEVAVEQAPPAMVEIKPKPRVAVEEVQEPVGFDVQSPVIRGGKSTNLDHRRLRIVLQQLKLNIEELEILLG